jgi:Lrp/AsnC family leucine-responsive transcriptional regulator
MNKHNIAQNLNIEEKIIKELQKNCRLNLDEIGKKCGCSRYKVGRVMKNLEENGTILGYTAIINPNKLNLRYYLLLVKRNNYPFDEMIKKIPLMEETDFVPGVDIINIDTFYVHGKYDWVLTFTAVDINIAKEFCNKVMKNYSKFLENIDLLECVIPFRIDRFRMAPPEHIKDIAKIL